MLCWNMLRGHLAGQFNRPQISLRLWPAVSIGISLPHTLIPQELRPPFLVLLACYLSRGISPFQELQGRLEFPVGGSTDGHQEREEDHPQQDPEHPPKPMHSPQIVIHRSSPKVRLMVSRLSPMNQERSSPDNASLMLITRMASCLSTVGIATGS